MTIYEQLHTLVDGLSADDAAAALAFLRQLRQAHDRTNRPLSAQERLGQRMGPAAIPGSAFVAQAPTDLATLAAQQAVRPLACAEDLRGDVWPEDEDIDLFLATLRRWRHESDEGHDSRG
ncbi:MAG TPA: hypothetical protein VFE42_18400 [Chloroflexota bacterium]|nr:hypothetical protein [Chloroflexota bacterium]